MRKDRGFTLIEMLVSLAVIGMLIGVLAVSLSSGMRVAQSQERALQGSDRHLLLDATLRNRLRAMVPAAQIRGRSTPFFALQSDQLSFVSMLGKEVPVSGPHVVSFRAQGSELWFVLSEWQQGRAGREVDRTLVARADRFRFVGGEEGALGLPKSVTLEVTDGDQLLPLHFNLPSYLPIDCLIVLDGLPAGALQCPEGGI